MSNTKEKAPINWHFTCQLTRIYENFNERYFGSIQGTKLTVWKIQTLIRMIKMIWKKKWMTWLGCTRQCKKNWKQHHIRKKSKLLPWYLINGLKCTVQNTLMSLNTFSELHMKSKSVGGILAKTITTETLYLVTNAYEGGNFSR